MEQPTRSAAAAQTSDPGCDGRNPREGSDCLHIEAASVVKVFGEPEEIEVPACVGEEFCKHDTARFAESKESQPWNRAFSGRTGDTFSMRLLPFQLGQFWVLFRRPVFPTPPNGPEETGGRGEQKNPAPAQDRQHQGDERWGHDHAGGCSSVDDAHRGGTFLDWKPFRDGSSGGWETAAFARAEQQAADRKHTETRRKAVTGTRQRPDHHDREKPAPGAQKVHQ